MIVKKFIYTLLLLIGTSRGIYASPLDKMLDDIKDAPKTAKSATVSAVLDLGLKEKRSAEVAAVLKPWFKENPVKDPTVLYQAGLNYELAGDLDIAASFYRQLLNTNPLPGSLANKAVPTLYRLMIQSLNDESGAFLYMRKEGARLRNYGSAKKFDLWYIHYAFSQKDLTAVAERLAIIFNTQDFPNYSKNLDTLIHVLESTEDLKTDSTLNNALKSLAKSKHVPKETKARLNWLAEITPLNAEVNDLFGKRKEVPASLYTGAARAAEALVAAQPYEGSVTVARGWCNFYDKHTPNVINKSALHRSIKTATVINAMKGFTPDQLVRFLNTKSRRGTPITYMLSAKDMAAIVTSNKGVFNSLAAPDLPLVYKGITQAEAKSLAPYLTRNPHEHAAVVRAIAVGGTDFEKAMDALVKSERWRFNLSDKRSKPRELLQNVLKKGGDWRKADAKFFKIPETVSIYLRQCAKKANPNDRKSVLKTVVSDLLSKTPSIPGAMGLFDAAVSNGSDAEKVEIIKTLTAGELTQEPRVLLNRALGSMLFGNPYSKITTGPTRYEAYHRWGRQNVLKNAGSLAPYLEDKLKQQMKKGKLDPTLFGMWLRCVDTAKKANIDFMKSIKSSKAYTTIDPRYDALVTSHFFKTLANKSVVEKSPLQSLTTKFTAAQAEQAFNGALAEAKDSGGFVWLAGLDKLAAYPKVYQGKLDDIMGIYFPLQYDNVGKDYLNPLRSYTSKLLKQKDLTSLQPLVPSLWWLAGKTSDQPLGNNLVKLGNYAIENGDITTAVSIARIGLRYNAADSRQNHEKSNRIELKKLLSQANEALGIAEIPVEPGAPGFAIFKSQAEFAKDNLDTAWALYEANSDEIEGVIQQLRSDYCFWLLSRNVEKGRVQQVEDLVKLMTIWDRRGNANFSIQEQAELKLAYADVAFLKRANGTARAWYRKVADSREYKGSPQQYRAILGSVAVDREEKNYAPALNELEKLMLIDNDELRTKVQFARAQIYFAQENFVKALEEVGAVLRRNPKHSDAVILQAEIWMRMRRLEVVQNIDLGDPTIKEVIVPGEYIKIDLVDPTLSLSGTGSAIEAEVRAASGDVERIMLRPLGDGKSKYRAEVLTELGAPKKGDKKLQVLGRDVVTYGYSKRFRAKMNNLPKDPDDKIGIASDFRLDASAGAFPARAGERQLSIEELGLSTAAQALGFGRIRPGNPIYVRVSDPDQSKTGDIDTLPVEIKSTSGDIIRKFVLKETGPYTGEFEGEIPTTGGQAAAYAYSSAPGRDPNMVISPTDYPGWVGQPTKQLGDRYFTVDLNDNVALKSMTIATPEDNRLTRFIIQTSLNGNEWFNRGVFPAKSAEVWTPSPMYTAVATYGGKHVSIPALEGMELPKEWASAMQRGALDSTISSKVALVKNFKGMNVPNLAGHPGYSILLHFRAYFYQSEVGLRRFSVSTPGGGKAKELYPLVIMIDGNPATGDDPLTIERELKPGLHKIDIWRETNAGNHNKAVLLCNSDNGDMVPCPDSMFDPAKYPKALRDTLPGITTVSEQAKNTFSINFGSNISAQMVRILIASHAGTSPAIKKITLSSVDGKQQLPVSADYQNLRKNNQLEVLPGDTVFVKYVDDRPYMRRTQAEKRLTVAFNTAEISASFMNYKQTSEGRQLVLEDIRRFKMDDNVGFIIKDADMDITPKRDTIPFKVRTSDGNTKAFKAFETEPHSGIFLGKVFPVTGTPKRESEIKMEEGGTLTAIYRDMENLDPGIPTDRLVTVEHAKYVTPQLGAYTAVVAPMKAGAPGKKKPISKRRSNSTRDEEAVTPRLLLAKNYVSPDKLNQSELTAVFNDSIQFDVVAPHLALATSSTISAYVQTESGRNAAARLRKQAQENGKALPPSVTPFDVSVPGTLKLTTSCNGAKGAPLPHGYEPGAGDRPGSSRARVDEGRFSFAIPLSLGGVPVRSFATKAAEELPSSAIPDSLNVKPGDKVYIGYAYLDKDGKPQWMTVTYSLKGQSVFDVLDKTYAETFTSRFVGQKVFVRVIAPHLDKTNERDTVTLSIKSQSGFNVPFTVRETFEHTGIFKGNFKLDYAKTTAGGTVDANTFFNHGFPVRYGDTVTLTLDDAAPSTYSFDINNGADGSIEPFSKRYTDDAMAIKTNFTLAECWFELAKKHRDMGKDDKSIKGKKLKSLSRREMLQAKKLLNEALATHRDPEQQAQAEYLLGNLSQEHADTAENEKSKEESYRNALALFTKIPRDYPDAIFASKSQYKKAMVYEKMGEVDIAIEEYVKLAYKYPDDELIPKAMSRIGKQFQDVGLKYYMDARKKSKSKDPLIQDAGVKAMGQANGFFRRAANIYVKLQERYPDNPLAGLSGVLAGENLMRLKAYNEALEVFQGVFENEEYDGPTVVAAAMFWSAWCNELIAADASKENYKLRGNGQREAFKLYNRVRYEHSTTVWAKKARGRLASKTFEKLIAEDKQRRERLLEGLQER